MWLTIGPDGTEANVIAAYSDATPSRRRQFLEGGRVGMVLTTIVPRR